MILRRRPAIRLPHLSAAALALALGSAPGPAAACALSLVLALDVSSSVDAAEFRQQRDGMAAALSDPAVIAAVLAQPGGVALNAFTWSGRNQQVDITGWQIVDSEAAMLAFAGQLADHQRVHDNFPTAIGYALGHAATLLRRGPACARKVIDISGDGVRNDGFPPAMAYDAFPFEGVTVNGLAIEGADPQVVRYYRAEVARGPGSFVEVAGSYADYAQAMKRKLLREIWGPAVAEARP